MSISIKYIDNTLIIVLILYPFTGTLQIAGGTIDEFNGDWLTTWTTGAYKLKIDEYWSNNRSHPTHQHIHEIIEIHLIQRGEKTLRQERLYIIRKLERSFLISNPMGRFSAKIIGVITKILISKKTIEVFR